ncbi:hypothetical protein [Psychromicrobium xiongbiense]|uniref:hypothetical protein n=1 Tax=Psychromicrobium xiongbiense TaxID=3051184 RepID=UPI00255403BC|nr:hypothetical protein [Psychromicrobium sp. YIM S02556]
MPKKEMRRGMKVALWCLLGSWAGWITCSIVALEGAAGGWPPYAGAFDVVLMAITGDSTITWALWGCRVLGLAMIGIVLGLVIWYVFIRRPEEAAATPS